MAEVVSPLAVTYSVTCQEWLTQWLCASRIFPTTCVHMCRVAQVSLHAASGNSGHASEFVAASILGGESVVLRSCDAPAEVFPRDDRRHLSHFLQVLEALNR